MVALDQAMLSVLALSPSHRSGKSFSHGRWRDFPSLSKHSLSMGYEAV